jgi:hypothetical protein
MVRYGSVTISLPVTQGVAGAGTDQQNVLLVAKLFLRPLHGLRFYWQVPARLFNFDAQRPWELEEALDLVLEGDLRYLLPDENMMKVSGTGPVPAEAKWGADQFAEQVGPGGYLHVQQYIEAAVTELPAQIIHGAPAATLVEFDKFDIIEAVKQTMLQFPDDPRDPGFGPVFLDGPDNGYNVRGVSECGKPQDADVFRLMG